MILSIALFFDYGALQSDWFCALWRHLVSAVKNIPVYAAAVL